MYNASHPKAGGDPYDRVIGTRSDTAEPVAGGDGVDTGGFGQAEDWSAWSGSSESPLGSNPFPEDMDNTAFGRIDIPV
nr:hypothetical protein [Gammaproteobacteria bacterium]